MERKNKEDFLLEHKKKLVITIVSLLLLTGLFLLIINTENNAPVRNIDTRANVYSGDYYESEEKSTGDEYISYLEHYRTTTKVIYVEEEHDEDEDYDEDEGYRLYSRYSQGNSLGIYYYKKYVPHMREYKEIECYKTIPEDKLFYKMCPGY